MEKNHIIIIALVALIIILAGAIFAVTQMQNVDYDRIEIVPNGTSIEMVNKNTVYNDTGAKETGLKIWTCDYGTLNTYNSAETTEALGFDSLAGAVAFKAINETINQYTTASENIDGITVKTVKNMGSTFGDTMYAVYTYNNNTHDNIIIFMNNKDIAVHMAKSIQYKVGNITVEDSSNAEPVNTDSSEKTYPVYADDGTLMGYYPVGAIVYPSPNNDAYKVTEGGKLVLYKHGEDEPIEDEEIDEDIDMDEDTYYDSSSLNVESDSIGESSSASSDPI